MAGDMIPFARLTGLLSPRMLHGSVTTMPPVVLALGSRGSCDSDISSAHDVGVSVMSPHLLWPEVPDRRE